MGDYTFCQMEAKDLPLTVATLVASAFYYDDHYTGTQLVEFGQRLLDGGRLTINEIPVGYSEDLFEAIMAVQKETGIDFRFRLWEDPKYEWLGTMHYHIPGLDDASAPCGTDGDIRVSGNDIAAQLTNTLHASGFEGWIRRAACITEVQAWNA